ncbi:FHA domain-containing protein [Streptomyces avermitilis]|uniref:FHA domain-containing protein n=1 Tax=Streptomyces avermitilis TaxID=33903 RepID=UPI0036CEAB89
MQIRLTVVDPLGPPSEPRARAASCDVLVTAPAGTALAAVASGLASAVVGDGGAAQPERSRESGGGPVVLYAGAERLDAQRCTLGEPPLTDGAVLSLGAPVEPGPDVADVTAELHVVAGPDAGGVHLLHGGRIQIGRSADADVPLDDPDVSRLHCAVTVAEDGRVAVADLGSTNGTTLDGRRVGDRAVRFAPGALLRLGESALRLALPGGVEAVRTAPDGEGHVRVADGGAPGSVVSGADGGVPGSVVSGSLGAGRGAGASGSLGAGRVAGASGGAAPGGAVPRAREGGGAGSAAASGGASAGASGDGRPSGETHHAFGASAWGAAGGAPGGPEHGPVEPRVPAPVVPGQGGAPRIESRRTSASGPEPGGTGPDGRHVAGTGEASAGRSRDVPGADTRGPRGGNARDVPGRDRRDVPGQGPGEGRDRGRREVPDQGPGEVPGHGRGEAHGRGPGEEQDRGRREVPDRGPGQGHDRGRRDAPNRGPGDVPGRGSGQNSGQGFGDVPGQGPGDFPGGGPGEGRDRGPGEGRGRGPSDGHRRGPGDGHRRGSGEGHDRDPREEYGAGPGEGPGPDDVGGGIPGAGPRKGTPLRGTDVPQGARRRGGFSAWARRLTGGRGEPAGDGRQAYDEDTARVPEPAAAGAQAPEKWPDPAALLLTALGPGPRLWERGPGHPEALTVRLGTADRTAPDGSGLLPAVPVTAGLREAGALGLAGPRTRLAGLARAVVAQLAALHSPDTLEIVLISGDRSRPVEERTAEWSWLGWLPHLKPAHGQDCRLLLAYDRDQTTARTDELLRRLEDHLADTDHSRDAPQDLPRAADTQDAALRGGARRPSWARNDQQDDDAFTGPYTVVIVDGDPGGADVREAVVRLVQDGAQAGIHVICLAETAAASPSSPVTETYEAACAVSPAFRECGAVALLSGDVATALRLLRVAPGEPPRHTQEQGQEQGQRQGQGQGQGQTTGHTRGPATGQAQGPDAGRTRDTAATRGRHGSAGGGSPRPRPGRGADERTHHDHSGRALRDSLDRAPAGHADHGAASRAHRGPVGHGTVAAVDAVSSAWAERFARALAPLRTDGSGDRHARVSAPLPQAARLLDELGLARATPASLMARWADAADDTETHGGRAAAVLGAGPRGPVGVDLVAEGPHLLIEGPAGSGRTELLRALAASLAAAERPDRLGIVLIDGRDRGTHGAGAGDGLRVCTDLPHVTTHLAANDPVRMREFAQSLSAELKRRAELLGRLGFAEWHAQRAVPARIVPQRTSRIRPAPRDPGTSGAPGTPGASGACDPAGAADLDTPPSSTLRLRPAATRERTETGPPARLVVVVDDLDALLSPALGSPGRPAAGSVVRALEAVAREGERLGVHLVTATSLEGRTAQTEPARAAALRITLEAVSPGVDEPAPGRGQLTFADGRVIPFQGGRVTGRIPRTATLRPTVVPLEWHRMGDPPARRPVRELGNGPTDLALLASALERAARSVSATEVPSLL